ncbi:hypothetical protein EUX98_g6797 [Antrodiella citrinella]|uniref:Cupin type-1 domain-containing protein n=1 Tax=Antrodiella citrinella TaxID=2447956 RepID=A0A4S4MN43_9APHY|nr:hypothetical protein EUX98_g6797 [Antrodiella citrinella]
MLSSALPLFIAVLFCSRTHAFTAGESEAQEVADLKLAPTANDRLNLLNPDSNFVFNFTAARTGGGAAGVVVTASAGNFPAVVGQHLSMAVGFLGPCGLVTPHTHPRATEFNYAINGSMTVGMLTENGARFVSNTVNAGEAVIFPEGSIHFEMNLGCDSMIFVAGLNNEDPGVNSISQEYFGLPPDVVAASLGNATAEQVAQIEAQIVDNVALGTDECLQRCGITRTKQSTTQRVQRVASNALPSGFSGPPAPPASTAAPAGVKLAGSLADDASNSSTKLRTLDIVLIAVVGALALGYVAILISYCARRGKQNKNGGNKGIYTRPGAAYAPGGGDDSEKFMAPGEAAPFESFQPYSEGGARTTPYDAPSGAL